MINQLHYTSSNLRTPESISSTIPPQSTGPLPEAFRKSSDFSNDTSFNLPAQADNTLLTPDSATQSPMSQHTKFTTTYPTPPSCSSLMQDTSGNARMYWNSSFDMNAPSSQASSPITTHPSMGPDFLTPYEHDHGGRRTPAPPNNSYLGSFGVSNASTIDTSGPTAYYESLPAMEHPSILRDSHQAIPDPRNLGRAYAPSPIMNHPLHSYRDDRRNSLTETSYQNRSMNGSPRSVNAIHAGRVRKNRRAKKPSAATGKDSSHDPDPLGEHMNCRGQEVPPTLKSSCPDEERCIFESRWRHRKDKGQDMWTGIQKDYQQHFGRTPPVKETLQMKFKRARAKYIEWLPEDIDTLRAAWMEMEEERYETLLQKFLKKGGSRNMLLNATDIEFMVVSDLKLEEGLYMPSFQQSEGISIRRRQKANPPKKRSNGGRSAAQPQQSTLVKTEPDEDTIMDSHAADEIIKQVQEARRDYDKFSIGSTTGSSEQHVMGRWGPGVGMMGSSIWGSRQSINVQPVADHLLSDGGGPSVYRRQT